MGLDVKVYGNTKITENEEEANFIAYVIDEDWKYKIKHLEEGKAYTGDFIFRGVSYAYSSHNRFREKLIKLVNREDLLDNDGKIKWSELSSEIPFYDLIHFADNEGCLDWEVSKTIYSDFEKHNEKAKLEMNSFDYSDYLTWLKTFRFAKNNGVVVFY